MRIFLEGLMKNPDDEQPTPTPGSDFSELLEQVNVGAVARCGFEKLSHLVDEDYEPPPGPGIACRNPRERIENTLLGPRRYRFPRRQPAHRLYCFADDLRRPVAPPGHRQDAPTPSSWRQASRSNAVVRSPRTSAASSRNLLRLAEQAPEHDCEARLPAAVRPGPSERELFRLEYVARHALENLGRRTRTDEAFQRRRSAKISFQADGAPIPARNVHSVRERHQAVLRACDEP